MRRALVVTCMALMFGGCVTEGDNEKPKPSPREASMANLNLGAAYLRRGDLESAVDKLQKAVDIDDRNTQAHATLALAYEQIGQSAEADKHYQRAIRLSKNDAVIDNLYGAYLCRNGRLDEAQTYLLRAAQNPRYRTPEAAYTNAGICAVRGDEWDKAEEYFRSALQANSSYALALWQMASLSYELDRDLQARAFIERLAALGQLPSNALWLGHRVEQRLGNDRAADRYAQALKSKFPDSRETAQLLEAQRNGG